MARRAPVGLIIAGVAVLAAAGLLVLILNSGDDDAAASPRGTPGSAVAIDPAVPGAGGPASPPQPQVATTGRSRDGSSGGPGYTETVIDGVRVRDHRKDKSLPIQLQRKNLHSPNRRIAPAVTSKLSDIIVPGVRECAAAVPAEAREGKPRIEGDLVIAIEQQQLRVTGATLRTIGVSGAFADTVRSCVEQKALAAGLAATDENDVAGYNITVSFVLP